MSQSLNIINNKSGWIVEKRNPNLLAKKIIQVLSYDEDYLNEVSNFARSYVMKNFSLIDQKKSFKLFFEHLD